MFSNVNTICLHLSILRHCDVIQIFLALNVYVMTVTAVTVELYNYHMSS